MPHKHGTYLGGIRSTEDLRLRCRVDEITGCWHWSLSVCNGSPKVHFSLEGRKYTMHGRRAALCLQRGGLMPAAHVAWAHRCTSGDCVNPSHARSGTKAEWGRWLASTGRLRGLPTKIAAADQARAKRRNLVQPDVLAAIQASPEETIVALAARLGVSRHAVWCARNRPRAEKLAANASVFTARWSA